LGKNKYIGENYDKDVIGDIGTTGNIGENRKRK
jgi:hypothetical protein